MAATSEDLARLNVLIDANITRLEKNLQKAGGSTQKFARKVAADAKVVEQSFRGTGVQTANVAAQFQDIGVQLASGTSPFTVAIQQAGQLSAALGTGGLKSSLAGLVGGFKSLISPTTLAVTAMVAAAGYAVQFFTATEDGADNAEKSLDDFVKKLKEIGEAWGIATDGLDDFVKQSRELGKAEALVEYGKQATAVVVANRTLINSLGQVTRQGLQVEDRFEAFAPTLLEVKKELEAGTIDWTKYKQAILDNAEVAEGSGSTAQHELALEIIKAFEAAETEQEKLTALNKIILQMSESSRKAREQQKLFADTMKEISEIEPISENTIEKIRRLTEELLRARAAGMSLRDWTLEMSRLDAAASRAGANITREFQELIDITARGELDKLPDSFRILVEEMRAAGYEANAIAAAMVAMKNESEGAADAIGDSGTSFGLFQHHAERATALKNFAREMGTDWADARTQIKFFLQELEGTHRTVGTGLRLGGDATEMAKLMAQFEGFKGFEGGAELEERVGQTRKLAEAMGGLDTAMTEAEKKAKEEADATHKAADAQKDYILSIEHRLAMEELESKLLFETAGERERQLHIQRELFKLQEQGVDASAAMRAAIEAEAVAIGHDADTKANAVIATEQLTESNKLLAEQARAVEQSAQIIGGAFADAFEAALINGEDLNDVLQNLVKTLASSALRSLLMGGGMFGGAGIFPSIFGGLGGAAAPAAVTAGLAAPMMAAAPAMARVQIQTTASPYFDQRVSAIGATVSSRQLAAYDRANPAMLQSKQMRGLA